MYCCDAALLFVSAAFGFVSHLGKLASLSQHRTKYMDIGRYISDPLTWVGKLGGLKSTTINFIV